ncbi:MAG: redoxin domain-containing protein [Chloroflexi bacterium]|nr:redoxin domain-containing protein [Chloroflexota bacterium]
MATSTQTSDSSSGWTRKRLALFLLSLSPFIALLVLLAWGQVRSGGNPGNLLEHNQSGEIDVTQRQAPAFEGIDVISHQPVNNSTVAGKIVMVDFWSSWCVACKAEAAELAEVYLEYADEPVEFVGLAIWDEALRHIQRYGVTYPNMIDEFGSTAVTYGVRGVPEKFFLDTDGTILRKVNGPVSKEQLREIIDSLLVS